MILTVVTLKILEQAPDAGSLLNLILGPLGTLVVLCVVLYLLNTEALVGGKVYRRSLERETKLDALVLKMVDENRASMERLASTVEKALGNK